MMFSHIVKIGHDRFLIPRKIASLTRLSLFLYRFILISLKIDPHSKNRNNYVQTTIKIATFKERRFKGKNDDRYK